MVYTEIVSVLRVKAIQVVISDDKVKSDTKHLQFFLIEHKFQLTELKKMYPRCNLQSTFLVLSINMTEISF